MCKIINGSNEEPELGTVEHIELTEEQQTTFADLFKEVSNSKEIKLIPRMVCTRMWRREFRKAIHFFFFIILERCL